MRYLVFNMGDGLYAADAMCIAEILRCPPLTAVPGSSPAMLGMFVERDRLYGTIDLAEAVRIGEPRNRHSLSDGLVLLMISPDMTSPGDRNGVALYVDSVIALETFETVKPAPIPSKWAMGVAQRDNGSLVTVLDVRPLLKREAAALS